MKYVLKVQFQFNKNFDFYIITNVKCKQLKSLFLL